MFHLGVQFRFGAAFNVTFSFSLSLSLFLFSLFLSVPIGCSLVEGVPLMPSALLRCCPFIGVAAAVPFVRYFSAVGHFASTLSLVPPWLIPLFRRVFYGCGRVAVCSSSLGSFVARCLVSRAHCLVRFWVVGALHFCVSHHLAGQCTPYVATRCGR